MSEYGTGKVRKETARTQKDRESRKEFKADMKRKEEETELGVFRRGEHIKRDATACSLAEIREAIIESGNVVSKAAQMLECSGPALWNRFKTEPALIEFRQEAKQAYDDMAQLRLMAIIADPKHKTHTQAVIAYLSKQVPGWGDKSEIAHKDLGEVVAPIRALNAEEWAKQNETS